MGKGPGKSRLTRFLHDFWGRSRNLRSEATILLGGVVAGAGALGVKSGIVTGIGLFVLAVGVVDKLWGVVRPPEEQARMKQIRQYVEALVQESRKSPYATLQASVPDLMARYVPQDVEVRPERRSDSKEGSPGAIEPDRPQVAGIFETLATHRSLVIEGEPGVGKSSLLHYLSWTLGKRCQDGERSDVPVLVTASRLVHPTRGSGLAAGIRDAAAEQLGYALRASLPEALFDRRPGKASTWVVLIDGLDAILDERTRRSLVGHLNREGARPDSPYSFVVTSRPLPELAELQRSGFARCRVQPFDPNKLEEFATRWFGDRSLNGEREAELFSKVVQSSRIADLAEIPLLTTLAAMTFQRGLRGSDRTTEWSELPTTRAALYQSFVAGSLGESLTSENRQGFSEEWERHLGQAGRDLADRLFNQRRDLLEGVARWQQDGGTGNLAEEAARQLREQGWLTKDIRQEPWLRGQMLSLFLSTGLGYWQADDFVFLHDTIREFMAATREVADGPDPDDEAAWTLVSGWRAPQRREVVLFVLGLWSLEGKEVTALIERLRSSHGLIFAASAVAEGANVDPRTAEEILHALQGEVGTIPYPDSPDLKVLEALCRQLGQAWPLVKIARDRDQGFMFRRAAIEGLAGMGRTEEAVAVLLEIARDRDQDAWVRHASAVALARMGRTEEAVAALLEIARDRDQHSMFRRAAAVALARMGRTEEAVAVLLEIARDRDQRSMFRLDAIDGLAGMGRTEEALAVALEIARDRDQGAWVRRGAAVALAGMGRTQEALAVALEIARDRDQDAWVRAGAIEALAGRGRTEEAVGVLLEIAPDRDQDALVRRAAAVALARMGRTGEAVAALLEIARDRDADVGVRSAAIDALAEMGRTEEALAVALEIARDRDQDAWVRVPAIEALAGMGRTEEAVAVLMEIAPDRDQDAWVRSAAIEALAGMGRTEEAVAVVLEIARDRDQDAEVRSAAIEALGGMGRTEEAVAVALEIAQDRDQDAEVRRAAAVALAGMGRTEEAVAVGLEIARDRDQDAEVRSAAIEALAGKGRTEEAVAVLLEIAQDRDQEALVRDAAALALGGMGGN